MDRIKQLIKKIFSKDPSLAMVMNKARLNNTYCACLELATIVFFIVVPGQTNQVELIFLFIMQAIVSIISCFYIHFTSKDKLG